MYRSILIIKRGALGDILAGTAAIVQLRRQYPQSHLCLLSDPLAKAICPEGTIVDEIIDAKSFLKNKLGYLKILSLIRSRRFDLIVNLRWTSEIAGIWTILGKSKFTAGAGPWWLRKMLSFSPPVLKDEGNCHEYLLNLRIVQALGLPAQVPELFIHVGNKDMQWADHFFSSSNLQASQLLVITPIASSPLKAWPPEKFILIAKKFIADFNGQVLITYSPPDEKDAMEIHRSIGEGSVITPHTTVNQLAALVAKVKLCLCNNSGIMHVAYAVGTPIVCINTSIGWSPYGKDDVAITQLPLQNDHSNNRRLPNKVTHELLKSISVERVWDALSSKWAST